MRLKATILQGEGEQLDFKNKISNENKIAKTLVAFANNKGGKLLIGVADDGHIIGVKNEDEERFILERAAYRYCKPAVEIKFDETFVDDKLVLIAEIPESDVKPHYALGDDGKWWVYIRVKDKSILAGKVVVDVLKRHGESEGVLITYTDKEKQLLTFLNEKQKVALIDICKHLKLSRRKTQRLLVNMILAGIVKVDTTKEAEFYMPTAI
ncbi:MULTISPECIES: AlbA family DNA-binding domain-containing protein [Olivibacter]|uniref:Helix-turn-helix domain-containing protein n=2 Tax=Olivibacter TaxID=376469 RepID=A0ABV6HJX1_9SPHI|nr:MULTISPECIES: ATP-binding protein [Olivibacter]MCL4637561.1 ATP-binding protein [Olivibacter sp. UJ_SKK_5.1]MDM8175205.1 ATP-binding protein [Olivibacter sp. 47]MDX3913119.1 ATP-binding protein [Pseudosphingobacterium sp.]QEL01970.1 ATP-binding protein [Olivibacter sp. LS-1]